MVSCLGWAGPGPPPRMTRKIRIWHSNTCNPFEAQSCFSPFIFNLCPFSRPFSLFIPLPFNVQVNRNHVRFTKCVDKNFSSSAGIQSPRRCAFQYISLAAKRSAFSTRRQHHIQAYRSMQSIHVTMRYARVYSGQRRNKNF